MNHHYRTFATDKVKHYCLGSVFGKQAQRPRSLLGFIQHFQRLAPRRLLAVIDFSQIQNPPLHHPARTQTTTLLHAPVAVLLAIFESPVRVQVHGSPVFDKTSPEIKGGSTLQRSFDKPAFIMHELLQNRPPFRPENASTCESLVSASFSPFFPSMSRCSSHVLAPRSPHNG
jgi:hypothetical protein